MGSGGDLHIKWDDRGCYDIRWWNRCRSDLVGEVVLLFVLVLWRFLGAWCWRPGEGTGFVAACCYFSLGLYFWLGSISPYSFKLGLCEMIMFWLYFEGTD